VVDTGSEEDLDESGFFTTESFLDAGVFWGTSPVVVFLFELIMKVGSVFNENHSHKTNNKDDNHKFGESNLTMYQCNLP